jgi:UDP-3-O-[3-hydroxymyristoyl] N-acetylglucosamine deacetylase
LGTTLGDRQGVGVGTVEHLMAALWGAGVDNLMVELNGPEVPIMDGSAEPFSFLLDCAGVIQQDAPARVIRVLRPVSIEDGDKRVEILPDDDFSIEFAIDFDSPLVLRQNLVFESGRGRFRGELSRARTFGFLRDVTAMRAAGLARGGSLDNAVVIDDDRVLNEDGLRFTDEFVRHKVLDLIGDLYLAGAPLIGQVIAHRAGHGLNNRLLRALFADAANWRLESAGVANDDWRPAAVAAIA